MLCAQLFDDKLRMVEVKKGVQIGNSLTEGFLTTIDVMLTLTPEAHTNSSEEIDYLCSELNYLLSKNGSPVYPFRVLLK